MNQLQNLEEIPYPPAPWNFTGQMWMGMFRSATPKELPGELKHLLDPHVFVVSLIRYLNGTLRYDELAFGSFVRLGVLPGLYVDHMWVDNQASLWGGRRIWGLPKNLANFVWDGSTVRVADEQGLIAHISVDLRPARLPLVWTFLPAFGRLEQSWAYFFEIIGARLGNAGMQVLEWPARFPPLQSNKPSVSFAVKPFEIEVRPPKILRAKN